MALSQEAAVGDLELVRLCAEWVIGVELQNCEADTPHGGYLLTEDGRVWRVHRDGDAVRRIDR